MIIKGMLEYILFGGVFLFTIIAFLWLCAFFLAPIIDAVADAINEWTDYKPNKENHNNKKL